MKLFWKREKHKPSEPIGIGSSSNEPHINKDGQFQSDKYPDLAPDKIVLSFKDPEATTALMMFAVRTTNAQLSKDIIKRLEDLDGVL